MTDKEAAPGPGLGETIVLLAFMISFVALSIDTMLPALPDIGRDLGVERANDTQLVISVLFAGLATGQLIYGPLSDSLGRKRPIYAGFILFLFGCLLSTFAPNLTVMLAGRFLQGLGAAAPRIVVIAMVRDQYGGRVMARIMSLIMAVFIMVPVLAPMIGQGILLIGPWQAIFGLFFSLALFSLVWFAVRLPETLPPARRAPLSPRAIARSVVAACRNRMTLGYALAAGLSFGGFIGYLTSAQQIFQVQYGLGKLFPFYFAVLALGIGSASLANARLVVRHGMRRLSFLALIVLSACSIAFLPAADAAGGQPALWALMVYLMISFFCIGILFGNFNALAMEPLGHIAGVGSAVVGSLRTYVSLLLGTLIGQSYDGTVLPLVTGFAILGLAALALMAWTERGRLGQVVFRSSRDAEEGEAER
jgi:DHA1 family bicyclomycin/chloramphenicol resistance-like MFS transporter